MSYTLLNPEIEMTRHSMSLLPKNIQSRICGCDERCDHYVELDEYGRFCENAAREIALSLFALVEGINRISLSDSKGIYKMWTIQEIQFIIDWEQERGLRYGDGRLIAKLLNRSHRSVLEKINELREENRFDKNISV